MTLVHFSHSEDDLNNWGYALLNKDVTAAVEVFKLNTMLHPESANAFDSLGEAYIKAGNTQMAIENYRRSLALNPKNTNAVKMLKQISNN